MHKAVDKSRLQSRAIRDEAIVAILAPVVGRRVGDRIRRDRGVRSRVIIIKNLMSSNLIIAAEYFAASSFLSPDCADLDSRTLTFF
jgi:hypothetical protein